MSEFPLGVQETPMKASLQSSNPKPTVSSPESVTAWQPPDPLRRAFSNDEISKNRQRLPVEQAFAGQAKRLLRKLPVPHPPQLEREKAAMAFQAIAENRPELALHICTELHDQAQHPVPTAYLAASDAYLRLQRFREAEIALLHAATLSELTFQMCINLASFASIRSDWNLAQHYANLASKIEPHNPILKQLTDSLAVQRKQSESQRFEFAAPWPAPSGNLRPNS